jgi:hypothetical protein
MEMPEGWEFRGRHWNPRSRAYTSTNSGSGLKLAICYLNGNLLIVDSGASFMPSFPRYPLPDVQRTVNQLDTFRFTANQEANTGAIQEGDFL